LGALFQKNLGRSTIQVRALYALYGSYTHDCCHCRQYWDNENSRPKPSWQTDFGFV